MDGDVISVIAVVSISYHAVVHTQPRIMSILMSTNANSAGWLYRSCFQSLGLERVNQEVCNSWCSAFWWGSGSELLYTMTLFWQFISILYTGLFIFRALWSLCKSWSFWWCLWSLVLFSVVVRLRVGWGTYI